MRTTRSWSARARTAWRPRSPSRRRAARCSCSRRQRRSAAALRSAELTLPGFRHDVCSAIHPLALASPFLRQLPLAEHGLAFAHPEIPLAHPLDDGSAVALHRSVDETADGLGADAEAYRELMGPLAGYVGAARATTSSARCGCRGTRCASARFARAGAALGHGARACALRRRAGAGAARRQRRALRCARSTRPATAAFGLMLLMLGHGVGWPAAVGGSQAIADAMASLLRSLGGEIRTGLRRCARSPTLRGGPRGAARPHAAAGARRSPATPCPRATGARSARYRYGPGVFKLDYALDGPVPWTAPECRRAGTVHLGGTLEEIASAEAEVARGRHAARPYVLVAQQSLFDPTRAPGGVAHAVGLLPRAERLAARRTRSDRAPDRALRAGLPRSRPRAQRHGARRAGGAQPELHRRRHQRRRGRPPPAVRPPGGAARAVLDARSRGSSSARRRRRPAAACTACAAGTRRARRCAASCAEDAPPGGPRLRARRSGPSSFGILESPEGELVEGVGDRRMSPAGRC